MLRWVGYASLLALLLIPLSEAYYGIIDESANIHGANASTELSPATSQITIYELDFEVDQTRVWKLDLIAGDEYRFEFFKPIETIDNPLILDVVFVGPGNGNTSALFNSSLTSQSLFKELNSSFYSTLNETTVYFAGVVAGSNEVMEYYSQTSYVQLGVAGPRAVPTTGVYYLFVSPSNNSLLAPGLLTAGTSYHGGFISGTQTYFPINGLLNWGQTLSRIHFEFERQPTTNWYISYFAGAGAVFFFFLLCGLCQIEWYERHTKYTLGKWGKFCGRSFLVTGRILFILAVVCYFGTEIALRLTQIILAASHIQITTLETQYLPILYAVAIFIGEVAIFTVIPCCAATKNPYPCTSLVGQFTMFMAYVIVAVGSLFAFGAGYYAQPGLGMGYFIGAFFLFGGAFVFLIGNYTLELHRIKDPDEEETALLEIENDDSGQGKKKKTNGKGKSDKAPPIKEKYKDKPTKKEGDEEGQQGKEQEKEKEGSGQRVAMQSDEEEGH